MARLTRLVLVSLFLVVPLVSQADTEEQIRGVMAYYADLWTGGDFEGIRSFYHSDFVRITPEGPVKQAIRDTDLNDILGEASDQGEMAFSQVKVIALGDEHAVAYGKMSLEFKDGSTINNWFSTTYVKTPLGWKILLTND